MSRIRAQYVSRRQWATGFSRQFPSKIQVFAVGMPKAKQSRKEEKRSAWTPFLQRDAL